MHQSKKGNSVLCDILGNYIYVPVLFYDRKTNYFKLIYKTFNFIFIQIYNRLMNNKFTNYISNLSMEMYLSHMVVFRIVEKIGIMERIESPVIRYMTTYLLLVMLLVMGLTIYRKAINKLDELR